MFVNLLENHQQSFAPTVSGHGGQVRIRVSFL